jgi:chemotaxis protein CheD
MLTIPRHNITADNNISVSLAEVKVSGDQSRQLVCYGLGSCIGLCVYDPGLKIAGMAHIVLPRSKPNTLTDSATKFADVAVPALFAEMYKLGAVKSRLVVKLAGGAQMIQVEGFGANLEMGNKNIEATRQVLKEEGVRIAAEDVGGSHGRSVWLAVASGEVMIRTAGQGIKAL